jgi:hypothetical protein
MDRAAGFHPSADVDLSQEDIRDIIRRDVEAIQTVDLLVVLPGYEQSEGTAAEIALAQWLGIQVMAYKDIETFGMQKKIVQEYGYYQYDHSVQF